MIAFKTILVPVDFSQPSKKAVTYGLTLADQFDARLILAHVVPESASLAYAFPSATLDIERAQLEAARTEIRQLVPAEYRAKYDVQTIVKTGVIDEEVLGLIAEEQADLVVMGTHGRRSPGRWFLGSVTERILRRVPVPVLTVSHHESSTHTIGLVALRRVLYATDLCESNDNGLKHAVELARSARAQLTVLHSVYYWDRRLWSPGSIPEFDDERTRLLAQMTERVEAVCAMDKGERPEIELLVVEGRPFERIVEVADRRRADIIVLNLQSKTTLERAIIGSTAERVVRLATVPVLSVPPTD